MNSADPINPQRAFWELSPRLPDNCILTADSGSCTNWYARDLKMRRGMMATLSGTFASMGPGVPYAIAAKFAWSDRVAIAFVGDGAMLMNGNNELVTIAENWKIVANSSHSTSVVQGGFTGTGAVVFIQPPCQLINGFHTMLGASGRWNSMLPSIRGLR